MYKLNLGLPLGKRLFLTLLTAAFGLSACGCGTEPVNNSGTIEYTTVETATTAEPTEATEATEPPTEKPEDPVVRVVAVGDNLVQTAVYRCAEAHAAEGERYNFTYCYEQIAPLIAAGDLSILNQETLICNDEYEITGSNFNFNSPTELGDCMIDLGFNCITLANNHLLDKGADGLRAALDYWDSRKEKHPELLVTGAFRNEEDLQKIRITEINGMKIAVLSFTETTNGYQLPSDSELQIIYLSETERMQQQISAAKEQADAVIVAAHWGVEDTHTVSEGVQALAQQLVEWGADVVIGNHPHTAQTMEYLTRSDGTQGFVFYSMGNFISAQTDNFNVVGELADFELRLELETGQVYAEEIKVMPVITHYEDGSFTNLRLYPYYLYTEALANSHGLPYAPAGTAKRFNLDVVNAIIEANIPAQFRWLDAPAS